MSRTAILAGVIALFLLVLTLWDYSEARQLSATFAALDAAERDEPRPAAIPPERNAEPYYLAAGELALEGEAISRLVTQVTKEVRDGTLSESTTARIGELLSAKSDALLMLDRATELEFAGFGPDRSHANVWGGLYAVKRLASLRALHAASTGRGNNAARSLIAQLKLEGAAGSPMSRLTLDTYLNSWRSMTIADTEFVLSRSAPDVNALSALADAFHTADDDTRVTTFFVNARRQLVERYRAGQQGLVARLARPLIARDVQRKLRHYTDIIAASRAPWPARMDAILTASEGRSSVGNAFRRAIYPVDGWLDDEPQSQRTALQIDAASGIGIRAARIAVAVERYRRAHAGELPASLDALVPAYLPSVPIDPYSGQPMRIIASASAYVIYSVGPDGRDDGGDEVTIPPVAPGPSGPVVRLTGDVGVRITVRPPNRGRV